MKSAPTIGRDRSDTTLRDHEQLMAQALEGLGQVFTPFTFVIEVKTQKFVHLAGPCESLFGMTAAEMVTDLDWWETILAPSEAPLVAKLRQDLDLHGKVSRVLPVTLRDGQKKVVRVVVMRREILGRMFSVGSVFDLGEAERLGLDQDVFRMAVEHTHEGVAVTGADGGFVFLNREHIEIFGYDRPDELLGRSWRDLYEEAEVRRIENEVFPELVAKGVWRGRLKAKRRDGSMFYQALTLSLLPEGGLVCNCQDVSEQVDLAKRLEASESMFRTFLNTLPTAVSIRNLQGDYEFVNLEAFRVLGVAGAAKEEDLQKKASLAPHPIFEILAKADQEIATTAQSARFELPLRLNGEDRVLDVKKLALRIGSEAVTHVCTLVDDVTERKRLDVLADEHARELEAYHLMQREFISMVSHEFRTPLTSIEGVRYLLMKKIEASPSGQTEDLRRLLSMQEQAIATLGQLVDQVLLLNRIEHMGLGAAPKAVPMVEFMQKAVGNIGDSLKQERVRLTMSVPEDFVAMFDEAQMRVVLENLISNGLKYSPSGTKVTVDVSASDERWELKVTDRGRGIPKADQAKLFQPFSRATNVGQVPGTGLGLTIIRRVVDFHQGTVAFTSAEGKGTVFTLSFPRQISASEEAVKTGTAPPSNIGLLFSKSRTSTP